MGALARIDSNTREALNNITMDLMNMPVEDISTATGLSIEEINKLKNEK